jgi:enterochelin esterase family protein
MLWRATEETRNVFVFRLGDVSKPMTRLLDTDLWYKTFRLQKGARLIYQFATNLPDPKAWRGVTRFAGRSPNDPLNPHPVRERWNEFNPYEVTFFSAVELPSCRAANLERSSSPGSYRACAARQIHEQTPRQLNAQFGFTLRRLRCRKKPYWFVSA